MSNAEIIAQLQALSGDAAATEARMKELAKLLVCDGCGGQDDVAVRVMRRGFSPVMYNGPICKHCFIVWYEYGIQDAEMVRAESLKLQGRADNGEAPR